MNKFNDMMSTLKAKINARMTKESPKEVLDFIAEVNKDLDDMQESYNILSVEKTEIQDMYIKSIRKQGSTELPKEETPATPRTLEEIGADIIAKENGGK